MHVPLIIFGGVIVLGILGVIVWRIMSGKAYARRIIDREEN